MDVLLLHGSWSARAAAPLLRASCSPPAAVAVSSHTRARPLHRIMHVDPGRRDTYLQAPVKVQARAFRSNCLKRADGYPAPNLKREDVDQPDSVGCASCIIVCQVVSAYTHLSFPSGRELEVLGNPLLRATTQEHPGV
jgi:hypothetical protein